MGGYAEQRDAEAVVRSVFRLLSRHVSGGELNQVRQALPAEVRELWP
jgi:uncharacterized protein (DUF2267 family)